MSKTYTYAGWSFYKGQWKLRFANDVGRSKHLRKVGHEHVLMIRLPVEMTEYDAARHLFASEYIDHAGWRQFEPDGWESMDLLPAGDQHVWWCEWCEQHPDKFYPGSIQKAA